MKGNAVNAQRRPLTAAGQLAGPEGKVPSVSLRTGVVGMSAVAPWVKADACLFAASAAIRRRAARGGCPSGAFLTWDEPGFYRSQEGLQGR